MISLSSVPAVVLVGGVGSRLRPVAGDLPKPMVPISGRPFVEYLLVFLRESGIHRVVLSAGYGAETIRSHFGSGRSTGLQIEYSIETELLGTGGAIRLGIGVARAATCLVLNGDSFVDLDVAAMLQSHRQTEARITVALTEVTDAGRYGMVDLDPRTSAIRGFGEKKQGGAGVINAGIYLIERDITEMIPSGVVSFERDVLPRLADNGAYGFPGRGLFVDIGVPEDYRRLAAAPDRFLAAVAGPRAGVR